MLQLPASATFAEVPALLQRLDQAMAGSSGPFVVDASALQSFDTSAVALLLHAGRRARAAGRSFELQGAPPKLGQLAALYGVDALLGSPAAPGAASGGSGSAGAA